MKAISKAKLLELAKSLVDDGENIEYTRGICELIADLDGIHNVPHVERSEQIAEELGLKVSLYDAESPEYRNKMMHKWVKMYGVSKGDTIVFKSPYNQYKMHQGESAIVTEVVDKEKEGYDIAVLPMYKIRFESGKEIDAWPEEVT